MAAYMLACLACNFQCHLPQSADWLPGGVKNRSVL